VRVIQIKEKRFNDEFDRVLDKLGQRANTVIDPELNSKQEVVSFVDMLHRSFVYEICTLKNRLEEV